MDAGQQRPRGDAGRKDIPPRARLPWLVRRAPEYAGLVRADACRTSEVRDQVQAVKAKGDSLRREQLPLWFEHVRKLGNPVHAAYLQTCC
jgi:hypothetical protein